MTGIERVVVIGAGYAGGAVAALLARGGVEVEVIEAEDDVTTVGSGITLHGNALRVLDQVGVWEAASELGYGFDETGFRSSDGRILHEMRDIPTGGPELPAVLGMQRRDLAGLLVDEADRHGATFHFGTTVAALVDGPDGVEVTRSDGSTTRADLVIGADGVRSATRTAIGITEQPEPLGMGIWRVFTSRPEEIVRTDLCYDGPCFIAGFCPTGDHSLYAYLVEERRDRSDLTADERLAAMIELSSAYRGPWDAIRERMTDGDSVHYTGFEWLLLDRPWYRGRVVLIGDAAHNCPPTLAQGAAQALEDAAVLAEVLLAGDEVPVALDRFMDRRFDRAREVVEVSVTMARWMLAGEHLADIPATAARTLSMLCQPA